MGYLGRDAPRSLGEWFSFDGLTHLMLVTSFLLGIGIMVFTVVDDVLLPDTPEPVHVTVEAPTLAVEKLVEQVRYAEAISTARFESVRVTSYNSLEAQTDSTPTITSTGETTRYGIVALSRDLLSRYPYGTKVLILGTDTSPTTCGAWDVSGTVFEVQDTMHPRKQGQVDIWLPDTEKSKRWGSCTGQVVFLQ